ncbi:hypothetical protein N8I77_001532 [Diaporthe amygdali]|uniref:Zn(2)-C6 fungal-type domain-containing protein n=1 Tax=Phomopsis amygdali TaxID=1214568 RepID=A0AAD9SRR6_PHOAM|nr:hypothetical protein N8I77_001532 [Diaporthe amygdali]
MPAAKRQRVSDAGISRRPSQTTAHSGTASPRKLHAVDGPTPPPFSRSNETSTVREKTASGRESEPRETVPSEVSPTVAKPKRVRTGCLTCRNRHLKCDEALPTCLNCQKSNRKCERGIRLNFIDLKVEQPPVLLPPVDWKVKFQDESRQIASEYVGGAARYAKLTSGPVTPSRETPGAESRPQRPSNPIGPGSSRVVETNRAAPFASAHAVYYPGTLHRTVQEQTFTGYEEQLSHTHSRKSSDAFLALSSGPTPGSSHSGGGGRAPSFSLGPLHDPYGMREEAYQTGYGYRSGDGSSVASSLVPQGVAASSSGSYRHATGSGAPDPHDGLMTPQSEKTGERDYLNTPEEIHYMQVFIEDVAVWMDSLDNQKHFGRIIPYLALKSPMLLNAFFACGVKHLTLVDGGSYKDDKALYYYDTATTQLLRSLQNPERDTEECATTAVVLNVYEIMSERPAARMNHIAGARALIRECKWNAKSTGIGAACFWLNVGMEILSCLAFNWAIAWDPDHWGVDPNELMNMTPDSPGREGKTPNASETGHHTTAPVTEDSPLLLSSIAGVGDEEVWVHRILYIVAKVANFRASIPQFQEPSPHDEQVKLQSRFQEWQQLKHWCDTWNANCPRSLRPYGYLFAASTKSAFPNVWLIKRVAIVGRLFYHTAMCLLAQINPLKPPHHDDEESRIQQQHHAHQVCGIIAHTKDAGVSSVAIRSLAIAGAVLRDPREQNEVLAMVNRIYRLTGWNLKGVIGELRRAWGWDPPDVPPSTATSTAPSLPPHAASAPVIAPAAQGGTLGAAAVINQLFGPRDPSGHSTMLQQQQQEDTRRTSQPPLPPVIPSAAAAAAAAAAERHRHASLTSNPPPLLPSYSMFSASSNTATGVARHGSIASSSHPSPAGTAHTPASMSVSSTAANAPTPPSRPMVNPLLAQADFNQPNHPYREWYKPPEKGSASHHSFGSGGGGLWPY